MKTAKEYYSKYYGFNSILTHKIIHEAMESYATAKTTHLEARIKELEGTLQEIVNLGMIEGWLLAKRALSGKGGGE